VRRWAPRTTFLCSYGTLGSMASLHEQSMRTLAGWLLSDDALHVSDALDSVMRVANCTDDFDTVWGVISNDTRWDKENPAHWRLLPRLGATTQVFFLAVKPSSLGIILIGTAKCAFGKSDKALAKLVAHTILPIALVRCCGHAHSFEFLAEFLQVCNPDLTETTICTTAISAFVTSTDDASSSDKFRIALGFWQNGVTPPSEWYADVDLDDATAIAKTFTNARYAFARIALANKWYAVALGAAEGYTTLTDEIRHFATSLVPVPYTSAPSHSHAWVMEMDESC